MENAAPNLRENETPQLPDESSNGDETAGATGEEPTAVELLVDYLLGNSDQPPTEYGTKEMTAAFGICAQQKGKASGDNMNSWQKRFKGLQRDLHTRAKREGRFWRETGESDR